MVRLFKEYISFNCFRNMVGLLTCIFLLTVLYTRSLAQHVPAHASEQLDTVLVKKLNSLIKDFRGDVGIYVRHLPTGRMAAIRADELFPTASLIKVTILAALFDKIERGELSYKSELVYSDSLLYAEGDILGSFKDGAKITLSKVVMLMITVSDNTAALWCQHMAGTGTAINNWLEEHGFNKMRVNSRTPDRQDDWEEYGWGQTTPREMVELLVMIHEGRAVSQAASEEMYRVLTRIYWDGEALSQIPPTVQVASKQGAVNQSRSEVVLVNAPSGDYAFCVITKNQEDESWGRDNEGFVLLRNVSCLLWKHFEPESEWTPPPDTEKW